MKRLFCLVIILITAEILLSGILPALAQQRAQNQIEQQKIGYVNTDLIVSQMPGYNDLEEELERISQQWRNELKKMEQEIEELKQEFSSREILFTDEIRKQREEEIEQKVQQREQYLEQKFGPEGEYFKKQQELLEPIQRKVFEAISVVAQREDFDFVFDRAQNTSLLFSKKEWNINKKVLTELGITIEDSSN